MTQIGKSLLIVGLVIAMIGLLLWVLGRLGLSPTRGLPGDFFYDTGRVRIWVPIATMIVASIVLTIIINIILWIMRYFGR